VTVGNEETFSHTFTIHGKDFLAAGHVSTEIKGMLKELGVDAAIIRRVAIASYEAEMNVVMYANDATVTLSVTPRVIRITVDDRGPGIPDVGLAMQEGYSTATHEMREMGFGAGMGLPNIKKNSDEFTIESAVGKGTTLRIAVIID
jgi:anti-sigma regulatory factor (Ser/Thr protein kinase)